MMLSVLLISALACDLWAIDCSVELIKGGEVAADLMGFKEGRLLLRKTNADLALTDVAKFKWNSSGTPKATKSDILLLKRGDVLRGTILKLDGQNVSFKSLLYGTIKVSSKHIVGGGFFQPFKFVGLERRDLSEEEDRLFLQNGDTLGVTILSMTQASVVVKSQLGILELPRKSLRWFSFVVATDMSSQDGLLASAQTTSGDKISGKILDIDEAKITLQSEYGKFTLLQKNLVELRISNGGVVYLSDLQPLKVEEVPFFSVIRHYQKDKSVGGAPISLRGKRFEKGLGVHSKTRLTYKLNGEYSLFRAVIGIDDEAKGKGNTIFKVLGDKGVLFESGDLTGVSAAETVDLKVKGVQHIVLEVDYGKEFHIGDRAVWADARVIR